MELLFGAPYAGTPFCKWLRELRGYYEEATVEGEAFPKGLAVVALP